MKNVSDSRVSGFGKFEIEYNSDDNKVLDSLGRIEQTANNVAEQLGINTDSIYNSFGFDTISYQFDNKDDIFLNDIEQYMKQEIQEMIVPETDRNYDGMSGIEIQHSAKPGSGIKSVLASAVLGKAGIVSVVNPHITSSIPTPPKKGEYGFGDEIFEAFMKYAVDKPFQFILKHKKVAAVAGIFGVAGIGAYEYKTNENAKTWVDSGAVKIKAELSAAAGSVAVDINPVMTNIGDYFNGVFNEPPVADLKIDGEPIAGEKIVFNASGSYDPDGEIVKYEWRIDEQIAKKNPWDTNDYSSDMLAILKKNMHNTSLIPPILINDKKPNKIITETPIMENIFFKAGEHEVKLTIYDEHGEKNSFYKSFTAEKLPRDDIHVIFGACNHKTLAEMQDAAKYLNQTQKVPNENMHMISGQDFTYSNFSGIVKNVGINLTEDDTLLIDIGNHGHYRNGGTFCFSDKPRTYNEIAGMIKDNIYPETKKVLTIGACYDGSAIDDFENINPPNTAVLTSTSADTITARQSRLESLLYRGYPDNYNHDRNGDGKISLKELHISMGSYNTLAPKERIWQTIWDPENITEELFLVE